MTIRRTSCVFLVAAMLGAPALPASAEPEGEIDRKAAYCLEALGTYLDAFVDIAPKDLRWDDIGERITRLRRYLDSRLPLVEPASIAAARIRAKNDWNRVIESMDQCYGACNPTSNHECAECPTADAANIVESCKDQSFLPF